MNEFVFGLSFYHLGITNFLKIISSYTNITKLIKTIRVRVIFFVSAISRVHRNGIMVILTLVK